MSSSYESLGAAQNGAIMSIVKNGCWGPQHLFFREQLLDTGAGVPPWVWWSPGRVCVLKMTTAPVTSLAWGPGVLCANHLAKCIPPGSQEWCHPTLLSKHQWRISSSCLEITSRSLWLQGGIREPSDSWCHSLGLSRIPPTWPVFADTCSVLQAEKANNVSFSEVKPDRYAQRL